MGSVEADGCGKGSVLADEDLEFELLPPHPAATIESLRSLRYDLGSAIADIVDNSIAAEADQVNIRTDARSGWLAVIDNGRGMTPEELTAAMRVGSQDPLDVRSERDLGRFGFGLKTASFSQARELTVWSRTDGHRAASRTWDIDVVRSRGSWLLRKRAPQAAARIISALSEPGAGTVVLWRRIDQLQHGDESAAADLRASLRDVSEHLEMVFARFLHAGITIRVGRHVLKPWDPFALDHPATQELPSERLAYRGHPIDIRPYVLPHESKLTTTEVERLAGPRGWNAQQGFYLYRRDRLVAAGDWLDLSLSRGDTYNLARIAMDVPTELDRDLQLDVGKSGVVVPRQLHNSLRRIAEATRKRGAAVKRHRAVPVKKAANRRRTTVWTSQTRGATQTVRLNRSHPIITELIAQAPDAHVVRTALDLIEETVPSQLLPTVDPERRPLATESVDDLRSLAERVYETYLREGKSRSEAAQRLLQTEPFYLFPDIVEHYGAIVANP